MRLRTTEAAETFRALLTVVDRMSRVLTDELSTQVDMPLDRYEILLLLAGEGSMRPSELADRRHLSRSGATRLIDRLERDGLVERRSHGGDRRGTVLALTPLGETVFRAAGRVHLRGLERHIGAVLTDDEMSVLRGLLTKLEKGMEANGAPTV